MANISSNPQIFEYTIALSAYEEDADRDRGINQRRWRLIFKLIILFLFIIYHSSIITHSCYAQSEKAVESYKKANKFFQEQKNDRAAEVIDETLRLDSTYAEAHFLRAQLYEISTLPELALQSYRRAIRLKPNQFVVAYQKLIKHHLQAGDYVETKRLVELLQPQLRPNSTLAKQAIRYLEICAYAQKAIQTPVPINPEEMSDTVNQSILQYFPITTADNETLLFTTLRPEGDEDLFISNFKNGSWNTPQSISDKINTNKNEGTGVLSADGRTLVFTACDRREGYGGCDLYISYKYGDDWTKPKNIGAAINTFDWESHPSLSADGRTLYFVSDRQGGVGGYDIWVSFLDKKNQWSAAKNAGKAINSVYNEASPFIHANGRTLIFASEGYDNFGGYDLFVVDSLSNTWSKPENLGYPINTSDDQVALAVTADGRYGYYSFDTKRIGNQRTSKIYRFVLPDQLRKRFVPTNHLKGIITDARSNKPLKANIELIDLKTDKKVSFFESDALNGQYTTVVPNGGDWGLFVSAAGYFYKSLTFDYTQKNKAEGLKLDIKLDPLNTQGYGVLSNIYFESGKADLQEKSRTELKKLTEYLQTQPTLRIEIAGHTDDVGDAKQNQSLSQKRAQSVVNYLAQSGIIRERIKAVGYGKTRPIVPNTTDANRQLNRRIEWRVW
jgi:outer membrane protein OmpA-like peptidoglycan-associated protein/Tol biopolymer transport system component